MSEALAYVGFSGRDKEYQTWLEAPPADIRPKGFHPYRDGVKSPCGVEGCLHETCKPAA